MSENTNTEREAPNLAAEIVELLQCCGCLKAGQEASAMAIIKRTCGTRDAAQ